MAVFIIMGIMGEVAITLDSQRRKLDREAELLFRGQSYVRAIRSYYEAGDPVKHYPRNLDDLLLDARFIHKRHIRRLYSDPITGEDWALVRAAPVKRVNFPKGLEALEGTGSYAEWVFEYVPPQSSK